MISARMLRKVLHGHDNSKGLFCSMCQDEGRIFPECRPKIPYSGQHWSNSLELGRAEFGAKLRQAGEVARSSPTFEGRSRRHLVGAPPTCTNVGPVWSRIPDTVDLESAKVATRPSSDKLQPMLANFLLGIDRIVADVGRVDQIGADVGRHRSGSPRGRPMFGRCRLTSDQTRPTLARFRPILSHPSGGARSTPIVA